MKQVNEILTYRHRGYNSASTDQVVQVFGNDPMPTTPPDLVLSWDHDVTTQTVVVDHVEVPQSSAV